MKWIRLAPAGQRLEATGRMMNQSPMMYVECLRYGWQADSPSMHVTKCRSGQITPISLPSSARHRIRGKAMANFRFGMSDYSVNIRATQQVDLRQGWDGHRLALTFEVNAQDDYVVNSTFLISGSLWTSGLPGPRSWIGDLHPASEPIRLKTYSTTVILGTTVTDRLLRRIETARAGVELTLRAYLTLTGLTETQHWPSASGNEMIRIPDNVWRKQLAQLDAAIFEDLP
ncbi:hypothetical protein [Streptomyces sp. NPDC102487]|uniref:hypothetical protein n=1 Tax=Streptomyces sp. NPDC102487 TaxID=3366182 RepID=UPI0038039221